MSDVTVMRDTAWAALYYLHTPDYFNTPAVT